MSNSASSSGFGELFIVSAPSGAGKTTLIRAMMKDTDGDLVSDRLRFSVSHTTRIARDGEVDGRDYHFVDQARFQEMIDEGDFLEWARVHDHSYGTSKQEVLPRLERGVDVVLDIDVQGAEKILGLPEETLAKDKRHGILVLPPGYEVLRERLEARNLDTAEEIRRRMRAALGEVQRYGQYEYVIINDHVGRASKALGSIIFEKRHRRQRMQDRISVVLKDFAKAQP